MKFYLFFALMLVAGAAAQSYSPLCKSVTATAAAGSTSVCIPFSSDGSTNGCDTTGHSTNPPSCPTPTIHLSSTQLAAGSEFSVSVSGLTPFQTFTVGVDGVADFNISRSADANGNLGPFTAQVPITIPAGTYTVRLTSACNAQAFITVTITASF